MREKVLADGIPAESNAAGGDNQYGGYNMSANRLGDYDQGKWPRSGNDWKHSDIKNIAYSFNYNVFMKIVSDGGLQ